MQCSAVQCSEVQCSEVQCSAVQCSEVQCSELQCSAVKYSVVKYSVASKDSVRCSAAVHGTAPCCSVVKRCCDNTPLSSVFQSGAS